MQKDIWFHKNSSPCNLYTMTLIKGHFIWWHLLWTIWKALTWVTIYSIFLDILQEYYLCKYFLTWKTWQLLIWETVKLPSFTKRPFDLYQIWGRCTKITLYVKLEGWRLYTLLVHRIQLPFPYKSKFFRMGFTSFLSFKIPDS